MKPVLVLLASCSMLVPVLRAQQFQQQPGLLPGPIVWTEGVVAFDADGDGLQDILFTNGVGFSGPGTSLAPTLLINHGVAGSLPTFEDETATRLPAGFVQQGKGVLACDVDHDQDQDLIFADAFASQPRLLINDGHGVFTDQTASRFPALTLNSFGAAFGDVDDDGDLDLVFADAGSSAFGPPGGLAQLFLNDGNGSFGVAPSGQLPAVPKVGAQGTQLLDLDNDFDLDLVVQGKSSGQQAYLNDGTGSFALATDLLPKGTSNTYAVDFGDLDNDSDLDAFYISLSSFNEGTGRNQLVESGTLAFDGTTTTLSGGNGFDDNDLAFLDANDDGLLDVIVASLGASRERLYLNDGTFANGSFVYQPTGFSSVTDSSLDLAVADFDGDGRYDVVTGQGESGNFTNRYYANTGPADTRPPRIGRVEGVASTVPLEVVQAGGLVRRCWIQDAVVQDGRTFATATLGVTAVKGGSTQNDTLPLDYSGGGLWRGVIAPAASPTGLVGMDVTYAIHAADPSGNASDSAPVSFRLCGAENYGSFGPVNKIAIGCTPDPTLGQTMTLSITGGPPSQAGLLLIGFGRASLPFGGGTILVDPGNFLSAKFVLDASGSVTLAVPVPPTPSLGGLIVDFQALAFDPSQPAQVSLSIGLEICLCGS